MRLPRGGQRCTRVQAQAIGHALDKPGRHEQAAHHAQALALQHVDQLVANVVGLPGARADDDAPVGDGDRRPCTQPEAVGTGLG